MTAADADGGWVPTYLMPRAQRLALVHGMALDAAYARGTALETAALKTMGAFHVQFLAQYPSRMPLLLDAQNECGVRKPITTFIRPSCLPFPELFDVKQCARFLAGYVRYEPLDGGAEQRFPQQIFSPSTTLSLQVGNCIEMSVLLTSLLVGTGYRAFVVVGYAHASVCGNDMTGSTWISELPEEVCSDDEEAPEPEPATEYAAALRPKASIRSTYDGKATDLQATTTLSPGQPRSAASSQHPFSQRYSTASFAESTTTAAFGAMLEHTSQAVAITPVGGRSDRGRHGDPLSEQLSAVGGGGDEAAEACEASEPTHRPHCWVLVLRSRRDATEQAPYFIEPSTGAVVPLGIDADQTYIGVEAIFNEHNVYVNAFPTAPVSALTFDTRDVSQWESVFWMDPAARDEALTEAASTSAVPKRLNASSTVDPSNAAQPLTAVMAASIGMADAIEPPRPPELPVSWVSQLTLSRSQFESRFPGSRKTVQYANARVEWCAEYSAPDLRVLTVVIPDADFPSKQQVHILYRNRADHLRRRSLFPSTSTPTTASADPSDYRRIHDWYEQGRTREGAVEGLRELIREPGVHSTLKFYWRAREDGLVRRVELLYDTEAVRKVKEFYKGRDDRLWYRCASFDRPRGVQHSHVHRTSALLYGGGSGIDGDRWRAPTRVCEKLRRNPDVDADADVAKRVFLAPATTSAEYRVFYHYRQGSIIQPYSIYRKAAGAALASDLHGGNDYDGDQVQDAAMAAALATTVVLMPNATPPTTFELLEQMQMLACCEGTALMELRARAEESNAIVGAVAKEHKQVRAAMSVYDTLRNRPKETEAARAQMLADVARREASRRDYLAPYLARVHLTDSDYTQVQLTVEEARQVRDEALRDLKERLIQRGQIMQQRMDHERDELNRRQAAYQKSVDAAASLAGSKETEEFSQFCKEAAWRMKILDERLTIHIQQASAKYATLAQTLSEDKRLAVLYQREEES